MMTGKALASGNEIKKRAAIEWLKDNFKSFFDYVNPDWDWIGKRARSVTNIAV